VTGLAATGAPFTVGTPVLNFGIFAFFVVVTLVIAVSAAGRNGSTNDYYAGGRAFTGWQNGIAIGGDYLSAASFLGIAGIIAIYGYDGFLYSIGFLVGWLLVLMLISEPFRNTGRYTMADVLDLRLKAPPVRAAAAVSTLTVSLFYLLAQMAGAGALVSLLLGVNSSVGQDLVVAVVGILMIFYVLVGGMKGTTWVQIVKATILAAGAAVTTVWVLSRAGFSLPSLLQHAAASSPAGTRVLGPGLEYGVSTTTKLNFISLALALVLGTAGLPHVLMRFYTVPTAKEARRSVVWAIWLIGAFYLFTLALGYGAAALVGPDAILAAPGAQNSAAPLLAFKLGGVVLLGVISAVAFATILAVVAGLTITAATSFAHDIYASVIRSGHGKAPVTEAEQVRVSRITVVVIGIIAIGLGILANGQNIAFLVALAFAVAAAANLPTILYSLYWSRFNTRGALWSMYGGLISTIVLIIFSPAVSGAKTAMLPSVDFAWFPLANPGIVSIPLAFILGIVGTLTSPDRGDAELNAEFEVRTLTGVGAEKAVGH